MQKDIFIQKLFSWFWQNKRDLPWRKTYTPYHVWISEMMLQQTQMERGVQYFNAWVEKYPTISHVANAPLEDILHSWEGLGYYSRARNIHKTAQLIHTLYKGEFPNNAEIVRSLPGIGDYTMSAIMGIAFEQDFATIDANVERVFARLFNITEINLKKAIFPLVNELLPKGQARIYNQALMELGALVCKKNPQCMICPIQDFCESNKLGIQQERPVPKAKKEYINILASYAIIKNNKNEELIQQRINQKLWNGMWEYIGLDEIIFDNKTALNFTTKKELAKQALETELAKTFALPPTTIKLHDTGITTNTNYTNHKLCSYFFNLYVEPSLEQQILKNPAVRFVKNTKEFAMPSHHRKAWEKAHKKG